MHPKVYLEDDDEQQMYAQHATHCVNTYPALVAALEKAKQRITQLAHTTNTLSEKLGLGQKVHAEDFSDCIDAALALARKYATIGATTRVREIGHLSVKRIQ